MIERKIQMKIASKLLALLLLLTLLFSAVSCGGRDVDPDVDAGEKDTEPVTGPIVVTDPIGRTVTLEQPAARVVSCYYITSYATIALGAADRLVGIENKANTRPIYQMVDSKLLELPGVGTLKELSVETVAAQNPDLVLLPKKLSSYIEALEALGIPVLVVNPETDADLREMLTLIGQLLGVSEQAAKLIKFYDEKGSDFTAPADKPSVLLLSNSSYLSAAPAAMYQNDVITLAGGANALAESTADYWQTLSYEEILALNPDYLVIPCGAKYTAQDIFADAALQDLSAVQNGHILSFPSSFEEWDSPIPSAILGILWLRSALNPTVYSHDAFRKDVTEFYETFYGFTPAAETLESLF